MTLPQRKEYAPSGSSVRFKGGVPQAKSETYKIYVPAFSGSVQEVCEQALLIANEEHLNYLDATVKIIGLVHDTDCNGIVQTYYHCEVMTDLDATEYNTWHWSVRSALSQETRTTDWEGEPVIVSYPPAVDWFGGGTSMGVFYKQFEDQIAEMSVYIPGSEIQGRRRRIVSKQNEGLVLRRARDWQGKINAAPFFGWARGNVLCLGLDVQFTHKLRTDGWVIDETVRFMSRPGGQVESEGEEGAPLSPTTPDGWDSWVFWKDPQTGLIPPDLEPLQVRHYQYANFEQMLTTTEDVLRPQTVQEES